MKVDAVLLCMRNDVAAKAQIAAGLLWLHAPDDGAIVEARQRLLLDERHCW